MHSALPTEYKRYGYLTSELDATYHQAAYRLGLSDSAMRILYTICLSDGQCLLSDIIRLCGISKQTIHSALRKLEQQQFVYLETVDSKKKKVCLTPSGQVLAQQTVLQIIHIENAIFNTWTAQEYQTYIQLTEKYLSALREKVKALGDTCVCTD